MIRSDGLPTAANPTLKLQFEELARQQRRKTGPWMTLAWLVLIVLLVLWVLQDR